MKWLLDNSVFFPVLMLSHTEHTAMCKWLDHAKRDGWGVTVETYLGGIRKLMNPRIMQGSPLRAREAIKTARTTLARLGRGQIVVGGQPDDSLYKKAQGHGQIMDFYLAQVARDAGMKLVTRDAGLLAVFPGLAVYPK